VKGIGGETVELKKKIASKLIMHGWLIGGYLPSLENLAAMIERCQFAALCRIIERKFAKFQAWPARFFIVSQQVFGMIQTVCDRLDT
jgi:hypothetical protein